MPAAKRGRRSRKYVLKPVACGRNFRLGRSICASSKGATRARPTKSPTSVTDPVDQVLLALADGSLAPSDIQSRVGLKHRPTFRANYLYPAL